MAAAILHDVGKTREFTYGAEFGISEEGRLLGHLALGAEIINAAARDLDPDRRLALLNCVLSHHGPDAGPARARQPGDRGGARGFASPEALALYRLNALDASVKAALE
jgi:3'-5' exoribonuclease